VLLKENTKFDLNQNGCEVTASDFLFISFICHFYYTEAAVMTCDMVFLFHHVFFSWLEAFNYRGFKRIIFRLLFVFPILIYLIVIPMVENNHLNVM